MPIRTALCDQLRITHPVFSAGMGTVAKTDLVVAVSEAGGLGVLGGVAYDADGLRAAIREIRARTDKPFGVDLIVPQQLLDNDLAFRQMIEEARAQIPAETYEQVGELRTLIEPGIVAAQIEVLMEEAPPVFVSALGNPSTLCAAMHERGMTVMSVVGTAEQARACVDGGVDAIIAQGTEAGGHTGKIALSVLLPQTVDAVSVPVIAAGGIADGRGLAAALALGASAVWVGTRFAASLEAIGHPHYKDAIVSARPQDSVVSRAYSGKTIRTLRNAWVEEWEHEDAAKFPFPVANSNQRLTAAMLRGDMAQGLAPMGQVVGLIHDIKPAAEILREMVDGAVAVLQRLSGLVTEEVPAP